MGNRFRNRLPRVVLFLVISTVVLFPLLTPFFKPGRAWTYDVDYHSYRMAAFHNAVKDGNIPPRWSSELVYGWGSPMFSFNWSLPYWMGEPFLFAGWSITDASKAVVILSVVLSYLLMFFFLREWLGFWPALGGAVIYEWSLFRIYLLFTGGGLGMHAAFIFWPMLFWGVITAQNNRPRSFLLICLGTAGLMLSHQVMFLLIMPLYWVFALLISRKDTLPKRFTVFFLPFFTGLGLSAYFWLPAFLEQGYIHIGITRLLYKSNFLDLATILHQPGITDRVPQMQYWYWSTGWNLFAIASVASLLLLRDWKYRVMRLFAVFFLIGQLLMTRWSSLVWETVPLLSNFIYPVRFQALSLFCGSVLAAYIIFRLRRVSILVCAGLIAATVVVNVMAIPINWPRADIPDSYYYQSDSTVDMMGEYLPAQANIKHFFADYERFERYPAGRIIEGDGVIDTLTKRTSSASFVVRANSAVSVVINQLSFPGWVVTANGKPVASEVYGNGEMLVRLPKGVSRVAARFTDTPIRVLGNCVSVATAMLMVFWMIYSVWKKRPSAS